MTYARAADRSAVLLRAATVLVLLAPSACAPRIGTIGAVLAQSHRDGTVRVREVPDGLAAARAGIAPGDELLLVDGYDVRILSPERLHERLAGPAGSAVRLTLLHDGRIARVEVVRSEVADSLARR